MTGWGYAIGAGASLLGGILGGGARKKAEKRAFRYQTAAANQQYDLQSKLKQQEYANQQFQQREDINRQQFMQAEDIENQQIQQQRGIASSELMQRVGEEGQTGRLGMQLGSTERIATESQKGETERLGLNLGSQERQLGLQLDTQKTMQQAGFQNEAQQKATDAARARLGFGGRYAEQRGFYAGRY